MEDPEPPDIEPRTVTIKCGLSSSLKVPELLPLIERGVKFVSQLSVRGSRLVNGFLIAQQDSLPPIGGKAERERFIKQTLKLGLPSTAQNPVNGLNAWYNARAGDYEGPPSDLPPQWKEISDYSCKTYLTVFENNLWMNYESRLLKYLKSLYGEASDGVSEDGQRMPGMTGEAETLLHLICRHYDSGFNNKRAQFAPTLEQTQLVNETRALFGLSDYWHASIGTKVGNHKVSISDVVLSEGRLKRHYDALLKSSVAYLRVVEEFNAGIPEQFSEHLIKGWTIAPLCARKRHNLTIDREILMQMLQEVGQLPRHKKDPTGEKESVPYTVADFFDLAPDHFDFVFEVRRVDDTKGKRRRGHGPSKQLKTRCYVQTDGVVLNAQFQPAGQPYEKGGNMAIKKRKAAEAAAAKEKKLKENGGASTSAAAVEQSTKSAKAKRAQAKRKEWSYDGVAPEDAILVSIDPGRVNIMYAYREMDYGVYKLTRARFQEEGGVLRSRQKWLKWNRPLREVYSQLGANSPKTVSAARWSAYIAVDTANAPAIWSVNYSKQASRMRFHTYCNTKRVMEKFVAGFGKGLGLSHAERRRRIIVGYGHARFSPTGRGEMAVPTTASFKTVAKAWKTRIVNENYTSSVCPDCHGRLKKVNTGVLVDRNGRVFKKDNRGVHRCTSVCKTVGLSLKNRDLVGARDILEILRADVMGLPRPACYTAQGAPR